MPIPQYSARHLIACLSILHVFPGPMLTACVQSDVQAKSRLQIRKMNTKLRPLPKHTAGCWAFSKHHKQRPKQHFRRYPSKLQQVIRWLRQAKQRGQLLLQPGRILAEIQTQIDRHQRGSLYLLFGHNHRVVRHYQFFNELLRPGDDQLQLNGLTHLALEAFVHDPITPKVNRRQRLRLKRLWKRWNRSSALRSPALRKAMHQQLQGSQQPLLDLFLQHNQAWAYSFLKYSNRTITSSSYAPQFLKEVENTVRWVHKYHRRRVDVVATDMSLQLQRRFDQASCAIYALREIFSLHTLQRRKSYRPGKRKVITYFWGADHIRKRNLPRFLSPADNVFSVRFAGGQQQDIWDQAFQALRWKPTIFALRTPNAEEADLMIHFPPAAPLRAYSPFPTLQPTQLLSKSLFR
ncbi:MAG: hypothetical protein AAGJ35_07515 [Myxococcota bacterium]